MACERWREILSAQLDGEDDPAERPLVEEHLAGCAGCREWLDRAAMVNRLTRTGVVAQVPDLSAAILAALPDGPAPAEHPQGRQNRGAWRTWLAHRDRGAWRARQDRGAWRARRDRGAWRTWRPTRRQLTTALFVALALVGAVQLILGLAQVGGGGSSDHVHGGSDATAGHLWHESAAWNVAVGAAYLFLALRRSRPAGLVPMLTAFVGMLLLLSVNDLTADRVDSTRLVSHGFVIVGYLLVVALSKVTGDTATPPGARASTGSGWRLDDEDDLEVAPAVPALRLVPRPHGPLTAEQEAA
jgi:predicted anti-sigma-YlaC factor YlaD